MIPPGVNKSKMKGKKKRKTTEAVEGFISGYGKKQNKGKKQKTRK